MIMVNVSLSDDYDPKHHIVEVRANKKSLSLTVDDAIELHGLLSEIWAVLELRSSRQFEQEQNESQNSI